MLPFSICLAINELFTARKILGITATGRATIERLDMNDERHDDGAIQRARRFWIRGGWHPPAHDPQL